MSPPPPFIITQVIILPLLKDDIIYPIGALLTSLADLRGAPGTRALWVQILSFSCSFWEIFDQIIG